VIPKQTAFGAHAPQPQTPAYHRISFFCGLFKDTVFLPQLPTKIPIFLNNKHRITEEAAPVLWEIFTKVWKEMK
jgi:hypothetical protein